MSAAPTPNRRELIATVTGGALLGAIWGAAFPIVATERRPTIAVVGHHNAQVVLIDTSGARALILSGEPDDELMKVLPTIMTVFRQRIELLVATPDVIGQRGLALQERWGIRHTIALTGYAGDAPTSLPTTVVDTRVDIVLDHRMSMAIRMGHRDAWKSETGAVRSSLWCATLSTPSGDVVIAPDTASIAAIGPGAASLLIAPDVPAAEFLAVSPASALAVNYDSDSIRTAPDSGPALTRIYPRDVARIVGAENGLELPEWTAVHDSEN